MPTVGRIGRFQAHCLTHHSSPPRPYAFASLHRHYNNNLRRTPGFSPLPSIPTITTTNNNNNNNNNNTIIPHSAASFPNTTPDKSNSLTPTSITKAMRRNPWESKPEEKRTLSGVIDWTINLPWQKMACWIIVALLVSQLKDFFGIAMGTFIISFVGNGFVTSAEASPLFSPFLRNTSPQMRRRILVVTFYSGIAMLFTFFGVLIIPDVIREGADFVHRLQTENLWVVVLEKMRKGLGDGVMTQLERFLLVVASEDVTKALDFVTLESVSSSTRSQYLGNALQKVLRQYTNAAAALTSEVLSFISRFAIQLFVSLVLSFMTVWDLPRISRGIQSLKTSRIAPLYNTIAPSLEVFATLFGKALQAQARIAAVNTILTALGMWGLKIPGVGLMSMMVFTCGFIPIAGVLISTIPIGFVALTEYGFIKLALVLVMITGVHFVEAYGLNPAIYSAHLKLHPLMVLAVLVVAEHSLGVWGLLLAVPMTVFALDYMIMYPNSSVTDVAVRELESVESASLRSSDGAD